MYSNGPKIVTDSLTLCLDAGNAKSYPGSGTGWTDISRNGGNGTLTNGPTFNSANAGSIVFDGTNDYVIIPSSSLASGTQMTFSVWNFGTSAQTSAIIWFGNSSNIRMLYISLPWSDGVIYFDAGNGTGNSPTGQFDRTQKSVSASEYQGWNYWTFTKNSTANTMKIYRNGQLFHSGEGSSPIGTATGNAFLCFAPRAGIGFNVYHVGNLAMAKLYSRELTAVEILQNYNATKGRFKL